MDFDIKINPWKLESVNERWGNLMPMMAMEELGELTQAISKMERFGKRPDLKENVVEEIGDVLISIGALMARYDIDSYDVESYIDKKLNERTYLSDINKWCEEHKVSVMATNCLLRSGLTLEAFMELSERELYKIHRAGKKTVGEFKKMQKMWMNGE